MFRKVRCSHLVLCFICLLPTTSSARAQGTAESPSPAVTVAATTERVRFTAPSTVQQIRLEVYNAVGVKLFDNEVRGGNVLDWRLQDGQAELLADGAYLCLVTVKYLSGRLSQKLGAVTIEQGLATLQPAEASQMSAQQAQAIGPVEAQAALTVLGEAERQTATVIAHTGSEGQLIRGHGALSFRLGDFYRGQDQEQMRLTAEGKLGLGVSDPQAKLDVAGLIRTSEGLVFPDGTVQTTAYVASGRTLSERAYMQRDAQGRNLAAGSAQDKPAGAEKKLRLAPTGSADRIPKFAADGTSLIDSLIKELGGQVSINSPLMVGTNGGAFGRLHVVEPASTIIETLFFENNSTANVTTKGTGIGFYGRDTVNSLKNTGRLAVLPVDANWIDSYLAFYTRGSDALGERVRITSSGNVGIGTTNPASKLGVATTSSATAVHGLSRVLGGIGVLGTANDDGPGAAGVSGDSNEGFGVHGTSTDGTGVSGYSDNYIGVGGGSNFSYGMYGFSTHSNGVVGQSGIGNLFLGFDGFGMTRFRVRQDGQVRSDVGFTTPAADFAEMLPAEADLEAGDVLVIGRDGKLARSTRPRQTSVAGVYSTKPGFIGGQAINSEQTNTIPLSVVGIVPVKVTTENGPVRPGDLLTSSSTPGYAMRAGARPAMGTVIGKALSGLQNGSGVIQMLAILQ